LPVSIVIVSWDSANVLPACLASLAQAVPGPAELIVVDNASADSSVDLVRAWASEHPAVTMRLIENDANRGFAAGANAGIAAARQPYVCLVNPDIRLRQDTLRVLWASLANAPSDVAVVGGKLLRAAGDALEPTDIIDSTGIVMTRDGRHFDRGAGTPDQGQFDEEEDVFGITGALAMYRFSTLEASRVDGEIFDEDFFAYREDADLAWRLQGFGSRALYVPTAVAYHRRTVTPERRRSVSPVVNMHSVKNRFLLRIHHADRGWLLRFGLPSLARDILVIGACLTIERSSLTAFAWLARNLPRHVARRSAILGRRSQSSIALRNWFTA
jgi:GT2 family glycosyltransferase